MASVGEEITLAEGRKPASPVTRDGEETTRSDSGAAVTVYVPTGIPMTMTLWEMVKGSLRYACGALLIRVTLMRLLRSKIPNTRSRLDFTLQLLSALNAIIGSVFSYTKEPILQKLEARERQEPLYREESINRSIVAKPMERLLQQSREMVFLILGYLLHDLVAILPYWRSHMSFLAHHVVGWIIGFCILKEPREMLRFVPGVTRLELSSVAMNIILMSKGLGWKLPPIAQQSLSRFFLVSFTHLRVLWYPWFFYKILRDKPTVWQKVIGTSGQGLVVAQYGLHLFWFYFIVKREMKTRIP